LVSNQNVQSTRSALTPAKAFSPPQALYASLAPHFTPSCHRDTAASTVATTRPFMNRGLGWLFGSPGTTNRSNIFSRSILFNFIF
jgi:hypothetical protein